LVPYAEIIAKRKHSLQIMSDVASWSYASFSYESQCHVDEPPTNGLFSAWAGDYALLLIN